MEDYNNSLQEQIQTLQTQIRGYQERIADIESDFEERNRKLMLDTEQRIAHVIHEKDIEIECLRTAMQSSNKKEKTETDSFKTKIENLALKCPDYVDFAEDALSFICIVDKAFILLDKLIAPHYDDDEANYFYVRRRLKFMQSAGDCLTDMHDKWMLELHILSKYGFVLDGSNLYKVLGGKSDQPLDVLKYYLYNAIFHKIAGPTIILLREMKAISTYVDLKEKPEVTEIEEVEYQAVDLLEKMGFSLVDVKLFTPLEMSDDVDCVEQSDVDLPFVETGDVYELVKLAVNYGTTREHSKVKIIK